jgi:hypothetical protein
MVYRDGTMIDLGIGPIAQLDLESFFIQLASQLTAWMSTTPFVTSGCPSDDSDPVTTPSVLVTAASLDRA